MTSTSPEPSPPERTLAVLQPGYLPWLGFFDQMRRADVFVYYDDVQYDKHGWRNRNRIKSTSGPHWLTVPVRHAGLGKPLVLDVEIDGGSPWARKHLGSIRQYYKDAPYLTRYWPELEELLQRKWDRLVELNLSATAMIADWLGITTCSFRSSALGIDGERSERLLKLCQRFGATKYLSGNAAESYLDVELFRQNGVVVEWQNYRHPTYQQLHGDFVPYLSAVDLLLNCGEDGGRILRGDARGSE
jgi:WbqC-like protein